MIRCNNSGNALRQDIRCDGRHTRSHERVVGPTDESTKI